MFNSPISAHRKRDLHYRLEGSRCLACDRIHRPALTYCSCGSKKVEICYAEPKGSLVSFTHVSTPSAEFRSMAPYCLGLIELLDGTRIVAQLADVSIEDLCIGMRMRGAFRKLYALEKGIVRYGLKFIPE